MEGTLTPTVLVEYEWWDLQDTSFMLDAKAETALLGLTPTDTEIPEETSSRKHQKRPLASLSPIKLVAPLLKPHLLLPARAYNLVKSSAEIIHLAEAVQPLLSWCLGVSRRHIRG